MTPKLQTTIQKELEKFPKEVGIIINSFAWPQISKEIGEKYLLTEVEINDLDIEIGLVLIGLQNPDSFSFNAESNIGLSKNEAKKITEEVFEKIFNPIFSKLDEKVNNSQIINEIKKEEKKPGWEETLNFIHSGGDYSA